MRKVLLIDSIINEKYKLHCSEAYFKITSDISHIKIEDEVEKLDFVVNDIESFNKIFEEIQNHTTIKTLDIITNITNITEICKTITVPENITIEYFSEKEWFRQFIEVEIYQPEELLKLMENNANLNKHYILMKNIDMTDNVCLSIGKFDKPFIGRFNGNNKIITINKIGENFNGLFGFTKEGAVIENINLEININDYFINNYFSTGAICGKNEKGLINNCIVRYNEDLNINNISKEVNYTGGLCGYNTGVINHCNVNFKSLILNTHFNFGVICGYNSGVINTTNVSITKDCKVYLSKDKYSNMGFLVGVNDKKDAIITNCMGAFGGVSIFNSDVSFNIGGIVGYNYFGLINSCNILFNDSVEIENEVVFGGVAYTNNGSIINSRSIFKKCKNIKVIINNPGKIIDVDVLIYNDENTIHKDTIREAPTRPQSLEIKQVQKSNQKVSPEVSQEISPKSEDGTNPFWIILLIILTVVAIIVFFLFSYYDCRDNHQIIEIKNIV